MAFHFRSQSEQYRPQISQQPQTIESIIREHSDSQQSLDRLFNPPTSSVPLRSRNLPRSFFDPSLRTEDNTNAAPINQFHSRSMSYGQQPQSRVLAGRGNNFHVRTHSTLAPMPDYDSGQSSLECLNSPSTRLNTTTNTHNQQMDTSSADCLSVAQQQSTGTPTDWSSPATSMEDLNGLSNNDVRFEPLTTVQHARPSTNLTAAPHHAPNVQPRVPIEHGPVNMSPSQANPVSMPYHAHNPQQPTTNFYNQTQASAISGPNTYSNNLHSRSMSFDQHRPIESGQVPAQRNFHVRTHSTLTPITNNPSSNLNSTALNRTPYQSPREFLDHANMSHNYTNINHLNNSNNNHSATGWSSSGYSSDDMTVANNNSNNFWVSRQQTSNETPSHLAPQHLQQPVLMSQPTELIISDESGAHMSNHTASIQQPPFRHQEAQIFYGDQQLQPV